MVLTAVSSQTEGAALLQYSKFLQIAVFPSTSGDLFELLHEGCALVVPLSPAYQYKWCPIIWVWVFIFELELSVAQGRRPSGAFAQVFVPVLH
jgi:hypothetical protein